MACMVDVPPLFCWYEHVPPGSEHLSQSSVFNTLVRSAVSGWSNVLLDANCITATCAWLNLPFAEGSLKRTPRKPSLSAPVATIHRPRCIQKDQKSALAGDSISKHSSVFRQVSPWLASWDWRVRLPCDYWILIPPWWILCVAFGPGPHRILAAGIDADGLNDRV